MSYLVLPSLFLTIQKYLLPRLGKRELFFCYRLMVILLSLFEGVSYFSGCLGTADLFIIVLFGPSLSRYTNTLYRR